MSLAALQQRIADRREAGMSGVTSHHIGMAFRAVLKADGTARDRGLAEIEGGTRRTHAAAHHHEAGFRRAQNIVWRTGE